MTRIDRLIAGSHPELTTHSAVLPGRLSSRRLQQLLLALKMRFWQFDGWSYSAAVFVCFCRCDPKPCPHSFLALCARADYLFSPDFFPPPKLAYHYTADAEIKAPVLKNQN